MRQRLCVEYVEPDPMSRQQWDRKCNHLTGSLYFTCDPDDEGEDQQESISVKPEEQPPVY